MTDKIIDMSGQDNPYLSAQKLPFSFRFKVYSEIFKDLEWLIKDAEINFIKKELKVNVYEVVDAKTFDWIEKIIREGLDDRWTLLALSAAGTKLYTQIFEGVNVTDHSVKYDYSAATKIVTHSLAFSFKNYKRIDKN
jgi:hypothetical protein